MQDVKITCTACGVDKPKTEFYWVKSRSGLQRTLAQPCKHCRNKTAKAARRADRVAGKHWYLEASGGKHRLKYGWAHRWGSEWLKVRGAYTRALGEYAQALSLAHNIKARRIIDHHLSLLPKCLPYVVYIDGDEWPIIAAALIKAQGHDDILHRRTCTNLYRRLSKQKVEAKYDHLYKGLPES